MLHLCVRWRGSATGAESKWWAVLVGQLVRPIVLGVGFGSGAAELWFVPRMLTAAQLVNYM